MTPPAFVIVGNPENRRVTMFQEALARQGRAPAHVIAWIDLARDPSVLDALPAVPTLVRIDSFGEDFAVERALLARGYDDALAYPTGPSTLDPAQIAALTPDRGRILAPRQAHLGFLRVLGDLRAALDRRPHLRVLNEPAAIEELFDKSRTSERFAAAGIPVPESFAATLDVDALRARLDEAEARSVYVKLTCGSSASCLGIWTRAPRESLVTSMEITPHGLYNSLRLRRYADRARIDRLLEFLLREGAHVERAIPKARADGRFFDCRVLAVSGEPVFTVMRTSRHPITNLHLGGTRGDLEAMRRLLSPGAEARALESCRALARLYRTLHVGIDVMYETDLKSHRVLEANAFGDLLPNLSRDGLSVYEWEIRAASTWAPG